MRSTSILRFAGLLAATTLAAQAQSNSTVKPAAASGSASHAATGSAKEAPTAPTKVTVAFKTMAMNSPVSGIYYKSGNSTISLSAQASVQSRNIYTYTGDPTMEIYRSSGGSASAPEKIGTITFPKSGNYILFLTGNSRAVSGAALSNSVTDFPVGTVRFVNCTNIPMRATVMGVDGPGQALKPSGFLVMLFKGEDNLGVSFERTDVDPPQNITGARLSPLSPGMRNNEFIIVGNAAEVRQGEQPSFNIIEMADNPAADASSAGAPSQGGGQSTGGGRRGRRGGGTGG